MEPMPFSPSFNFALRAQVPTLAAGQASDLCRG